MKNFLVIDRPLSYVGAVSKATLGIAAYDVLYKSTPLSLVGKGMEKLWTSEIKGISGRELAARLEEKLLGVRTGAISEARVREATTGGVEWALKMKMLPYFLSQLPAFKALNLNPGEIWSMYRSLNMAKSGVGSFTQFKESWNHAQTRGEKALLAATAAVSAPIFLVAEKLCPEVVRGPMGGVNTVLMADIGLMRFVGEAQKQMSRLGLHSTKGLRFLESIETGITAAFAYDSGRSLAERMVTYKDTGSLNPLEQLKTEADLLKLVNKHPEYLNHEGAGVFGKLGRLEDQLIERIKDKIFPSQDQTTINKPGAPKILLLPTSDGILAYFSINQTAAGVRILKDDGVNQQWWDGEKWVFNQERRPDKPSRREQVAEIQAISSETKDVAAKIGEELNQAVHDYVYFSEDGSQLAFRVDLRPGETVRDKVDRLFAGVFEGETPVVDLPEKTGDNPAHITGKDIQSTTAEELAKFAGPDAIYERQLYEGLIQKLIADAEASGIEVNLNEVKVGFTRFLAKSLDPKTGVLEGEVNYKALANYIFKGELISTDKGDTEFAETENRYTELTFIIEKGQLLSVLLQKYGYYLTDKDIRDQKHKVIENLEIYKVTQTGETRVTDFSALDKINIGDIFIIRSAPPSVTSLGEDRSASFEIAVVSLNDTTSTETTIDTQEGIVRDQNGYIYIGEVGVKDTLYTLLEKQIGSLDEKWWAKVLAAHNEGTIKIYRVDEKGEPQNEVFDLIFPGNRLAIYDPNKILAIPDKQVETVDQGDTETVVVTEQAKEINEKLSTLQLSIKDKITGYGKESSYSVLIIDPDHPELNKISVNPDEKYFPASLQKVHVAMLVLHKIESGELTLESQIQIGKEVDKDAPTIAKLLNELIVNSSDQALKDFIVQLTGIPEFNSAQAQKLNELIQNQLGLTNTTYGIPNDPQNPGLTTATDMMNVMQMLYNNTYLNPEDSGYLLDLMSKTDTSESNLVPRMLEIYPGVEVAEKIGVGIQTTDGRLETHTMSLITTAEGRHLLVVVLGKGYLFESQSVIKDVTRQTIAILEPDLVNKQSEYKGDYAYILRSSYKSQQDFISSFIHPFGEPERFNDINPVLLKHIPDAQDLQIDTWEKQLSVAADATSELVLKDPNSGRTVIISLDSNQNLTNVVDSAMMEKQGVYLVDYRTNSTTQTSQTTTFNLPVDSDKTVEIGLVDATGFNIFKEEDRTAFVQSLTEAGNTPYDFLIFPGRSGEMPAIAYVGSRQGITSDVNSQNIRVAFVTSPAEVVPSIATQQAFTTLLQTLSGSRTNEPGFTLMDIRFKEVEGEVSINQTEPLKENVWYEDLFTNLKPELASFSQRVTIEQTSNLELNINIRLDPQVISALETNTFSSAVLHQLIEEKKLDIAPLNVQVQRLKDLSYFLVDTTGRTSVLPSDEEITVNILKHLYSENGVQNNTITGKMEVYDLLECAGIEPQKAVVDGVMYFDTAFFPAGFAPDKEAFAKEQGLDPTKLFFKETTTAGKYLVGIEVLPGEIEGVDTQASFTHPNGSVLYVYKIPYYHQRLGQTRYRYDETLYTSPQHDPNKVLAAVYPLSTSPDKFKTIDKLVPLGTTSFMLQYNNDQAYAIVQAGVETGTVYVDPNLDTYIKTNDGKIVPLFDYDLSLIQVAEKFGQVDVAGQPDIGKFVDERILTTIERWTQNSQSTHFLDKTTTAGGRLILVDTTAFGTGQPATFSIYHDALNGFMVDETGHLIFTATDGNQLFTFAKETGLVTTTGENIFSLRDYLRDKGLAAVTTLQGEPVHYKGLLLFEKDDFVYVLGPEGLVSLGTRFEMQTYPIDHTGDASLQILIEQLPKEAVKLTEMRSFASLNSESERLVHSASFVSTLKETGEGLVDLTTGKVYHPVGTGITRLVTTTGQVILRATDDTNYYTINTNGTLEIVPQALVVPLTDFLSQQGLTPIPLPRVAEVPNTTHSRRVRVGPHVVEDRLTRLPVYQDTNGHGFVIDATGKHDIGLVAGLIQTGFIGHETNQGEFKVFKPVSFFEFVQDKNQDVFEKIATLLNPLLDLAVRETIETLRDPNRSGLLPVVGSWMLEKLPKMGRLIVPTDEVDLVRGQNYVPLENVSPYLIKAIIAGETHDFFSSNAPNNIYAVMRALVANVQARGIVQGASTLWAQTAEVLLTSPEAKSPQATNIDKAFLKIGDFMRAHLLKREFSGEEALAIYINSVNYRGQDEFGRNSAGILAGARTFFCKEPKDLNLVESALLAVVPQGPALNNADNFANAQLWTSKGEAVLTQMYVNGFIDKDTYTSARLEMHELIEPTGKDADVKLILDAQFLTEAQARQIQSLAVEYEAQTLEARYQNIDQPPNEKGNYASYANFYDYLHYKGVLSDTQYQFVLTKYYQPFSDTSPEAIVLIKNQSFVTEADKKLIDQFKLEYDDLDITTKYNNGEVISFYRFLRDKQVITEQEFVKLGEQFVTTTQPAWANKIEKPMLPVATVASSSSSLPTSATFPTESLVIPYQAGYLLQSRPLGNLTEAGNVFEKSVVSETGEIRVSQTGIFAATTKDTAGKEVAFNLVGTTDDGGHPIVMDPTTGTLFSVTDVGLRVVDGKVAVVDGHAVTLTKANGRNLEIMVDGVDPARLYESVNGDNYIIQASGEVKYVGRTVIVNTGGTPVEFLVKAPHLEEMTVSETDQTWATVLASVQNGLQLLPQTTNVYDPGKILTSLSQNVLDPNLGIEKQFHLLNPLAMATALENNGFNTTPVEISNSGDREGEKLFQEIMSNSVDQNHPMLVWMGFGLKSDITNIGTTQSPLYEQVVARERAVLVVDIKEYKGETYVVYLDPQNATSQVTPTIMHWNEFVRYAAPETENRFKALILGKEELPPTYNKFEYTYNSPERQVEMATALNNKDINWRNPNELVQKMTIDPYMQLAVEDLAQKYLEQHKTKGMLALAMDENGNMIFNVSLDENGKPTDTNKTTLEAYAPGSIFKLITGAWALENGLGFDQKLPAGGEFVFPGGGGFRIRNWTVFENTGIKAAAEMTLHDATVDSNNPFFTGLLYFRNKYLPNDVSDPDTLLDFARQVGFGYEHNAPGVINNGGLLGTDEWAQANPTLRAPLSEPMHALNAFGQGNLTVTPYEMLRFVGALANDGKIIEPNAVKGREPTQVGSLPNSADQIQYLQDAMLAVTTEGTAARVFRTTDGYTVYGKTGTAQTEGRPNAWFVGWAENDSGKKIVFAFLFPKSGEGSRMAAPLAKETLDEYFKHLQVQETSVQVEEAKKQVAAVPESLLTVDADGLPLLNVNLLPPEAKDYLAQGKTWVIGSADDGDYGWHGDTYTSDRFDFPGEPKEYGYGYDIELWTRIHHNTEALPGPEKVVAVGEDPAYGKYVVVRNLATGIDVFYAHLRPDSVYLKVGDDVTKETTIGEIGNSGTGSHGLLHLHMEVWYQGKAIKMNWWEGANTWKPPEETDDNPSDDDSSNRR